MNSTQPAGGLAYEVFVSEAPAQRGELPNGAPRRFSPIASTLIYGQENAVLSDPGFNPSTARELGDWVVGKGRKLTDIYITHGHGDHWFAAQLLADRFGARIVASAGVIRQMHGNVAARPFLWDKAYDDIPPSPVTAVTVPDNRFTLEGHELRIVDVGHGDSDDSSVLHVPDLGLVVAGDVIYNGAHQYVGDALGPDGLTPWRAAIDNVEALAPHTIVAGHLKRLGDDDAVRQIAVTRRYLGDAEAALKAETTALDYFNHMIELYPDYTGQLILWAGAGAQYGVREHPAADRAKIVASAWL
ncbi:MBL fold metallo-hydrolase [Kribbella sp. NPDC049174]|uniref:MBL fold metallo-hydrolase n=1 Tax=Kribbella sp. NPDC049174 TaxID=3364112 RepID=UPI00370FE936